MPKFNGMKLPKLPDYKADGYLHAYIFDHTSTIGSYRLIVSMVPFNVLSETAPGHSDCVIGTTVDNASFRCYTLLNDKWVLDFEDVTSDTYRWWGTTGNYMACIWSDTYIVNTDSSIFMPASEPDSTWDGLGSWIYGYILCLVGTITPFNDRQYIPTIKHREGGGANGD